MKMMHYGDQACTGLVLLHDGGPNSLLTGSCGGRGCGRGAARCGRGVARCGRGVARCGRCGGRRVWGGGGVSGRGRSADAATSPSPAGGGGVGGRGWSAMNSSANAGSAPQSTDVRSSTSADRSSADAIFRRLSTSANEGKTTAHAWKVSPLLSTLRRQQRYIIFGRSPRKPQSGPASSGGIRISASNIAHFLQRVHRPTCRE